MKFYAVSVLSSWWRDSLCRRLPGAEANGRSFVGLTAAARPEDPKSSGVPTE